MIYPLTISLVTFNGKKYVPFCFDSLLRQTYQQFQIIVIDNGSIDGTADLIEREYAPAFEGRLRVVRNKENLGFARAHNQAILWSDSEFVACVNQDMVLDEHFFEESIRALAQHPDAAAIAPKLLRWTFDESGIMASSKTNQIDSMGITPHRSFRFTDLGAGEIDRGQYDSLGSVFGVSGALPVYRRAALEDVREGDDFFDSDFHTYKEDIDMAFRLRWRGWTTRSVPAARAWHARSARTTIQQYSSAAFSQRRNKSWFINYHSYKNHLFVIIKNASNSMLVRWFPRIVWFELTKLLYLLIFEWKTLGGIRYVIRNLPRMLRKRRHIMHERKCSFTEMSAWFLY